MAPHSSNFVWKTPWAEKTGKLQSMGSLRVRHDWVTSLSLSTFVHWRRKWQPTPVSCLENPRDGGAWWAAVYRVSKTQTQFSSVQSLSHVQLFATPWTAACQASLSITNSRSLLKLMSIELMMPSNHFILCHPLLLLPSILPSIRVFSNESVLHIRWPKYCSFTFSFSIGRNSHSFQWIFRTDFL